MKLDLYTFYIFLYVLGLGALFGGLAAQFGEQFKKIDRAILYGVFLLVVSGLALMLSHDFVAYWKVGLASACLAVIVGVSIAHRSKHLSWHAFHGLLLVALGLLVTVAL